MSNDVNFSGRNVEKFVVRLPQGMRTRIHQAAQISHRSMNSEFIWRLEHSLGILPPDGSQSDAADLINAQTATNQVKPALEPTHTFEIKTNDGEKKIPLYQLDDREVLLLKKFRDLSQEKQQALVELVVNVDHG